MEPIWNFKDGSYGNYGSMSTISVSAGTIFGRMKGSISYRMPVFKGIQVTRGDAKVVLRIYSENLKYFTENAIGGVFTNDPKHH